ncbi:MAG: hypothetical protein AAFX01_12330 [Cyanobacteria bacterium J06638_28]
MNHYETPTTALGFMRLRRVVMLTACALTSSAWMMSAPFPLQLIHHASVQSLTGLPVAHANEAPASQVYGQTLEIQASSVGIREVEVNLSAWTPVVAEWHDGHEIQVIFDIYTQDPELFEAIEGPNVASSESASTLRVDFLYDGECVSYSYRNGVVTAAEDICLHSAKVLIPRNHDIEVYQLYHSQPTRQPVDFSAPVIYDYSDEL